MQKTLPTHRHNLNLTKPDQAAFLDTLTFLDGHESITWFEKFPTQATSNIFGSVKELFFG
jgi:hypothetical protein